MQKILLVSYENDAYTLGPIAKRLEEKEVETKILQADYYHFIDDNKIRQEYKRLKYNKWVNFEEKYESLYNGEKEVDWCYLDYFESTYCVDKTLQQLLLTDPILETRHHYRKPYYTQVTRDTQYYWFTEILKWVEREIKEFEPTYIFTIGRNYIVKNCVSQIAKSLNINMDTLIRTRVRNYCMLAPNFGYQTPETIKQYIDSTNFGLCNDGARLVSQYVSSGTDGLYEAPANRKSAKERLGSVFNYIKQLVNEYEITLYKLLTSQKKKYRRIRGNYFNSYTPYILAFKTLVTIRTARAKLSQNIFQDKPQKKYIYFPLHTIPESSTLTLSTNYDELNLIEYISSRLPIGVDLAVKENPNMIGVRPLSFYDKIKDVSNTKLISPLTPSRTLIEESAGVTGISGTALLEANMLKKPTHCFGEPEFKYIIDYKGYGELKEFISACETKKNENYENTIKYVQYMIDNGHEIDFDKIRNPNSYVGGDILDQLEEVISKA